jgi:hypothetical protein
MPRYHAQPKARSLLNVLGWIYIGGMIVWFGLRLLFFDSFWWLALLNTLAFYLFWLQRSIGSLPLCRLFFRPQGGKITYIKKKSTMLPQAKKRSRGTA